MLAILFAAFVCLATATADENRKLRSINKSLLKALATMHEGPAIEATSSFTSGARFYTSKNYQGSDYFYEESESIYRLPENSLNDRFNSVKVGEFSKVFAWRHYSESQPGDKTEEWFEDNPDISTVGGISRVKVTPQEVEGVYIRLVDGINTGKKYCMSTKVSGPGEGAEVYTCTDNANYQFLGTLNPTNGGESIVTAIAVRNMQQGDPQYGVYINNGSVYFKVGQDGDIGVSHDNGEFDNFPDNLTIEEVRDNVFDVTIISEEITMSG